MCVCVRARACVGSYLSLSRARARALALNALCARLCVRVCARARQRYRLEKRVGKGSYGVVYEALDTETGDK